MNGTNRMNGVRSEQHAADVAADLAGPKPVSIGELVQKNPKLREPVIDGLLRVGEVMNVIASPKVRKSWLVLLLAFSVMMGRKWLGQQCLAGNVLLIDNELHPETLAGRVRSVAEALEETPNNGIDVLSVRGLNWDLLRLLTYSQSIEPGKYRLIIVDALYRAIPGGVSENENQQMTGCYNVLDEIAKQTGAAIAIVHHSSKGDQSGKAQTDVGAGAGSIARAADCHASIRPHKEDDYFVLEASCRSFPPPQAKTIYFEAPLWQEAALDPELKNSRPNVQADRDQETRQKLLSALAGGKWIARTKLREITGYGWDRIARGTNTLKHSGLIESKRVKSKDKRGQAVDVYRLIQSEVGLDRKHVKPS